MNRHAYLTKKKDEIVELAKANPKFDVEVITKGQNSVVMVDDDERKKHFFYGNTDDGFYFSFQYDSNEYRHETGCPNPFEMHYQQWWDKMYTAIPITSRTFYRELKHFITLLS